MGRDRTTARYSFVRTETPLRPVSVSKAFASSPLGAGLPSLTLHGQSMADTSTCGRMRPSTAIRRYPGQSGYIHSELPKCSSHGLALRARPCQSGAGR